ncbi:MAG TPA: glycine--tRNA ligase [Rhodospirillaceae bacterium]|jgi:glycyl-tRNA synthetase|nr:glycine--tRNA ligase [Alphaproteobacteria bacterium]HBH26427.1 glycine--tRNA ligase [Rhodospirillaceae bacterium]
MADATPDMKDIVALAKRRGFVFPASEIYGGINGFWDFGPLGTALKNRVRDAWWRDMVTCPPIGPDGAPLSIVGLDSAIIQNPKVWEASGHVGGFSDPMRKCPGCGHFVRADHLQSILATDSEWVQELYEILMWKTGFNEVSHDHLRHWAATKGRKSAPNLAIVRNIDSVLSHIPEGRYPEDEWAPGHFKFFQLLATEQPNAPSVTGLQDPCPRCGAPLGGPVETSLMFASHTGVEQNDASKVYLRPETAQGIFINFKNVLDSTRVRVPFGIAQVGKAFRNEVTPRNFIFRGREFEQMEMEWFCHPDDAALWREFWLAERRRWWEALGIRPENLQMREHEKDELSHYAKEGLGTQDVEYRFPFTAPGFGELEGVAHRCAFDLTQHQEHSGTKMEYRDPVTNETYMPHVIEPAAGLTRGVLAVLCDAYTPDPSRPSGVYLNFAPHMAPVTAAVLPLTAKPAHVEPATKLYMALRPRFAAELDVKQNIGKRYARQDEIGTPYCFTVDNDTLSDQTVTVRHRNTMAQERVALDKVPAFLAEKVG